MRKILDYGAGKGPYIAVVFAGALWGTNGFFIKNLLLSKNMFEAYNDMIIKHYDDVK